MITKANFKEIIGELTIDELENVIDSEHDYIKLEVSIFNAGHVVYIESEDYNENSEEETNAAGNLYCDKDSFLGLLSEINIHLN